MLTVAVMLVPAAMVRAAGVRLNVYADGGEMVRLNVTTDSRPPEDPVIVTVEVPSVAVAAAVRSTRTSVVVPENCGGSIVALTPFGEPAIASDTTPSKPPERNSVIVTEALPPCARLITGGLTPIWKEPEFSVGPSQAVRENAAATSNAWRAPRNEVIYLSFLQRVTNRHCAFRARDPSLYFHPVVRQTDEIGRASCRERV